MSGTPDNWPRIKLLLGRALELSPEARPAFLLGACDGDDALRGAVERLLASHDEAVGFLESSPLQSPDRQPDRLGAYRVTGRLGEGGMGVVYEATDERLGRLVALKVIHEDVVRRQGIRERFYREARVAASVNHPHVCQIYDIGDEGGLVYLAMERLDGETLATRLTRGPLALAEAIEVSLGVLAALDALHRRGIVHRDVKPPNIFLTPHGVKLLDFGLALLTGDAESHTRLTHPGTLLGTPRYMAPEQVRSAAVDERADLFALSAILYEMLTGVAPFAGDSIPATLEKILHAEPPMVAGSPGVAAADRVIHRGLAKSPGHRFQTAAAMADALRGVRHSPDADVARRATAVTRLIVLPFRLLTPDSDVEFLPFSLAEAIASSLTALDTLVVRSSLVAARFATGVPDFERIATEASVDVIVTGTLMRSGAQLRVATELIEVPSGRVIWSKASHVTMGDIVELHEDVTRRIVESLSLPLSEREQRSLGRDVPSNARAFEFYLRGMQLSRDPRSLDLARDMYLEAVGADPAYAPAWARLESSLNRALELNPDLGFADRAYAQIEVDYGRSQEAMVRLVRRTSTRANDPDMFAGLVHSCRYCGLFDASLAAHERARRLDPNIGTSVQYTLLMAGRYDQALAQATGHDSVRGMALAMVGDAAATHELRSHAEQLRAVNMVPMARFVGGIATMLDGDVGALRAAIDAWIDAGLRDPEALFIHGLFLTGGGDHQRGLELMRDSVEAGYLPHETLGRHRWLDPLRGSTEFQMLADTTRMRHERAAAAFADAGGIPL
jgi:serine/threonine protein kinase